MTNATEGIADHRDAAAPAAAEPMSVSRANRLKTFAAIAAVTVALLLIVAKLMAWLMTGSVSLLSTLIDSLLDLAASGINLLAIHHAAQPADREHRFGHGKAEPLAGLAQAAFISGSAAFLMFEAVERIIHPEPISNSDVGIAVMGVSIILTFGLVMFQRFVVRRTASVAISADSLHYKSDLLANLAVIAALILSSQFAIHLADPVLAIVIALYILLSAREIFAGSYNMLMDRELPEEDRERIRQIALTHSGVINVHDLRTRTAGSKTFIQFHLELDGNLSLREAHVIADGVMELIERAFPEADVIIHEDPYGVLERRDAVE